MSMKRSRQSNSRAPGRAQADGNFAFGNAPPQQTWAEQIDGKGDDTFKVYSPQSTYVRGDFVSHPKFGKGVITLVEGSKVEVLFEEGIKKLGHTG